MKLVKILFMKDYANLPLKTFDSYAVIPLGIPAVKRNDRVNSIIASSTVQAHQTPPSSTASALKLTGCESAITFSVNHAFSLCDQ